MRPALVWVASIALSEHDIRRSVQDGWAVAHYAAEMGVAEAPVRKGRRTDKKQFAFLFVAMVVTWAVGQGLIPLLPVYALQLGATPAVTGYYLAFAWLMVSVGGLVGGWLSDRTRRRKPWMLICTILEPAVVWGMGGASNVWQLAALTGALWFVGGVSVALSQILVGLRASREARGRLFGILSMVIPLGGLLGGATIGPAADSWGYPSMLRRVAIVYAVPVLMLLLLDDPISTPPREAESAEGKPASLGRGFNLLLLASFVVAAGTFVANLTRSLAMNRLGYDATAIASTAMVTALVALPLRPLTGWLSDRLGRKTLLMSVFSISVLGRCAMAASSHLWHFRIAMALVSVSGVSGAVCSGGSAIWLRASRWAGPWRG